MAKLSPASDHLASYPAFDPEAIVEVTSVCDRACTGCYAGNLISKVSREELFESRPEYFLSADDLESALRRITSQNGGRITTLSLRGGEPSRHLRLADLIDVASRFSDHVLVETHGRWILGESKAEQDFANNLFFIASLADATFKLSFDRMHALAPSTLKRITELLDQNNVAWMIAITEAHEKAFLESREICDWIPDHKVIFQRKTSAASELPQPRLGVIRRDGRIQAGLSVREGFTNLTSPARALTRELAIAGVLS